MAPWTRPIPPKILREIKKKGLVTWGASKEEVQMWDAFFPEKHLLAPEDSTTFRLFICIRCGYRSHDYDSSWNTMLGIHETDLSCPRTKPINVNTGAEGYAAFGDLYRRKFPWGEGYAPMKRMPIWYQDKKRFKAVNRWRCAFGLKKREWIVAPGG